jgi:lambda family phage portal protein
MIHCYEKWHCNQFIGIPWLAPVLTTLWDLAQLQEDRIISSRMQAAIALWVKEDSKFPGKANKTGTAGTGNEVTWAPASIIKSPTKPEVVQSTDNIKETFAALVELYLYQVASGMGISYQEMCADTQGSSFSASRTVTSDRRRHYKTKQQYIVRTLCQPVDKRFVQWAFLCGLIPGKSIVDFKENPWGLCHTKWTPDKWDFVDPLKDMNSLVAERDAGWLTDEKYCELTGEDRDDLYATLAEEKKEKEKLGIQTPAIVQEATANKFPTNKNEEGDNAEGK